MDINRPVSEIEITDEAVFGERVGIFARIFGCRHNRMSRPVTTGRISYKYCSDCGIRQRFNPETFCSERGFYYPASGVDLHHV